MLLFLLSLCEAEIMKMMGMMTMMMIVKILHDNLLYDNLYGKLLDIKADKKRKKIFKTLNRLKRLNGVTYRLYFWFVI